MVIITGSLQSVSDSAGIDDIIAAKAPGRWAKNPNPYSGDTMDFDKGIAASRKHRSRQRTIDVEVEDLRLLPRSNGTPAGTNNILAYLGLQEGEERNAVLRMYGDGIPVDGAPIVRGAHKSLVEQNLPQYISGTQAEARKIFFQVANLFYIAGTEMTDTLVTQYLSKRNRSTRKIEIFAAISNSYQNIGKEAAEALLVRYPPEESLEVFAAVSDSIHRNGPEMTYAVTQRYGVNALPLIVNGVNGHHDSGSISPIIPFDYGGPEGSFVPISTIQRRSKRDDLNHGHSGRTQNHRHMQRTTLFLNAHNHPNTPAPYQAGPLYIK